MLVTSHMEIKSIYLRIPLGAWSMYEAAVGAGYNA
jgi:hypothetical protein